jgi:pimeloyl-ACP methyl ester carboxylesterase
MGLLWLSVLVSSAPHSALAQTQANARDPNFEHPNHLITVNLEGRSISGLASHRKDAKTLRYGVVLFPGYPGIVKLREQEGAIQLELRGNFLVRSRRHWLDGETLTLVADAPSDQWIDFSQRFRETPRYGSDIAALVNEASRKFGVADWTFVGTSDGSVTAFHAARLNPSLARRIILTSSVFLSSRNGPGLYGVTDWGTLPAPLLWVHHQDDPCRYTLYRTAREFAVKSASPLLTVRGGGPGSGDACEARTAHGFAGVERETVLAMRTWIKSGVVPPDVSP